MTTPNLKLSEWVAAQDQPWVSVNGALNIADALLPKVIVSDALATPPASPAAGACYIVAASATGAWLGWDGKIAAYIGGTWVQITPAEGWVFWVVSANGRYVYTGTAWVALIEEAPKDGLSYARKNGNWAEVTGGGASQSNDIEMSYPGTPGALELLDFKTVGRNVSIPADFAGAAGNVGANPTAAFAMDVQDDGVSIGTINIATDGTFAFNTGGSARVISAGSLITFVAPASVDATIADISATLLGNIYDASSGGAFTAYDLDGASASLILSTGPGDYALDGIRQTGIQDVVDFTNATPKSCWDSAGNIAVAAVDELPVKYDPVTLAKKMVIEPAFIRINAHPLCKDGTDWSDASSNTTNLSLGVFGIFDGASVDGTGVIWHRLIQFRYLTAGSIYPFDVYYRAGTSGKFRFNFQNGAPETVISGPIGSVAVGIENAGTITDLVETLLHDGVTYRLSFKFTPTGSGNHSYGIGPESTISGETIIAHGVFPENTLNQLPACPIIDGYGGNKSIAKDVASKSLSSFNFSATEGTVIAKFEAPVIDGQVVWSIDDGTANNRMYVARNSSGEISFNVVAGGVAQPAIIGLTDTTNGPFTVVCTWSAGDFNITVNGGAVAVGSAGAVPAVTTLRYGQDYASNNQLGGGLMELLVYPAKVSNASAIARSGA